MVSIETFQKIALAFPEAKEEPHFEITSFRVAKKIFATLDISEKRATLKLSLKDQDIFCLYDKNVMYPVPNKWGKQGWTHINLKTIKKEMCIDALRVAYSTVAPEKYLALLNHT
jgi:predicted DNA-binding protein (MmcQ/YjbR family)